jgi:hypothetical protein
MPPDNDTTPLGGRRIRNPNNVQPQWDTDPDGGPKPVVKPIGNARPITVPDFDQSRITPGSQDFRMRLADRGAPREGDDPDANRQENQALSSPEFWEGVEKYQDKAHTKIRASTMRLISDETHPVRVAIRDKVVAFPKAMSMDQIHTATKKLYENANKDSSQPRGWKNGGKYKPTVETTNRGSL